MTLPCSIRPSRSRVLVGIQSWRRDGVRLVLDLCRGGYHLYRLERRRRSAHVCARAAQCDGDRCVSAFTCSAVGGGNEYDVVGWGG